MRFEVYKDERGEWRWRLLVVANGEILAVSSEGYKNRIDSLAAVSLIQREAPNAATQIEKK